MGCRSHINDSFKEKPGLLRCYVPRNDGKKQQVQEVTAFQLLKHSSNEIGKVILQ
jgi:hypothetical protein